jgi:hypothetical protein
MGFNDHSHSNGGDLPPEAGNFNEYPFDPNDEWIKNAPEEQQIEAMRRWFHARFEDPSNQTPYDGGEGGFQFIWGGPYDPNDKIQERFSSVVEYEVMEKLIKELWQEAGDEWAPIETKAWTMTKNSLFAWSAVTIHFAFWRTELARSKMYLTGTTIRIRHNLCTRWSTAPS